MAKAIILGLFLFSLSLIADVNNDTPTSRSADLKLAVDIHESAQRAKVLAAVERFALLRNLSVSDASESATNMLSRPTVVRFYEDQHRAVILVTDRLERSRLLIGVHNAVSGPNSEDLDDALLKHLRLELEGFELVINPQE